MNEPKLGIPDAPRAEVPQSVPDVAPQPEAAAESRAEAERPAARSEEAPARSEQAPTPAAVAAAERARTAEKPAIAANDPALMKVERVLEANLWDVYMGMPEPFRTQFKKLGEDTAQAVRAAVISAHIRASKIHDLVHKWLKKIPGVNEFFLLQESKIKTDQLVRLATWFLQKGHII